MRAFRLWAFLILGLAVVIAGAWAYWNFELRWRPKTIDKHQVQIAQILESAGWVSPRPAGKKLYMVAYRACASCEQFKREDFPRLQAKGVDTRVIAIARPDLNGLAQSTPAERATVAQLWLTRDWNLMKRWDAARPESWTAAGIPRADGDAARTAVVEAGRKTLADLEPLLEDNGVELAYPLLIWWNEAGEMRACACDAPQANRFVRRDLGA